MHLFPTFCRRALAAAAACLLLAGCTRPAVLQPESSSQPAQSAAGSSETDSGAALPARFAIAVSEGSYNPYLTANTLTEQAAGLLRPAGKLVVISFHSLEDRIVKRFFEEGAHPERLIDARIALRTQDLPEPFWQDVRRIKPTKEECEENPRSRSAVMRSAVRTARKWMQAEGGAK